MQKPFDVNIITWLYTMEESGDKFIHSKDHIITGKYKMQYNVQTCSL